MSDPAVKQRLRRAKARAARVLQSQGWAVFPLACANCHLLAKKGRRVRAIRIDFIDSPGVMINPPIGVRTFEVWKPIVEKGEFLITSLDLKTGIKQISKAL